MNPYSEDKYSIEFERMPEATLNRRRFSIFEVNALFFLMASVFLTLGSYVQNKALLVGLLVTEFGILVLPLAVYAWIRKKDFKTVFRFKKLPMKTAFKIIVMSFLLIPAVGLANLITIFFIELFGEIKDAGIPLADSPGSFFVLVLVIAGSAGICEELFFRGMVLDGYEQRFGKRWGALFSGLLFGLFHFNLQNLLGPILLGIVFAYVVQVTGSIFAGMLAHFMNNGIAVAAGFMVNEFSGGLQPASTVPSMGDVGPGSILITIAFFAILAGLCGFGVRALLTSIRKDYSHYAVGDRLVIKRTAYCIIDGDEERLLLRPEGIETGEQDTVVNLNKIKQLGIRSDYKVWDKTPLDMTSGQVTAIVFMVILYAAVTYYIFSN